MKDGEEELVIIGGQGVTLNSGVDHIAPIVIPDSQVWRSLLEHVSAEVKGPNRRSHNKTTYSKPAVDNGAHRAERYI